MASRWSLAVSLALLLPCAWAQSSGWVENEVNTTMCTWTLPRVGVIRDTAYIDGGQLYWQPSLKDGSPSELLQDQFDHGLVYTLNFSTPFKTSDNFSSVLTSITSVTGASSDIKPIYYDGALLANDGEFLAYGGLPLATVAVSIPDAGATFGYQRYWYGGADKKFEPTFLLNEEITAGISRYVGFGAGVSVPSENKGYYFGGMNSKSHGPVNYPSGNATTDPSTYSRDLISVDMTNQMQEVWTNKTINSIVPGRASPEMVWVPVGKNGVLVVIGGVVDPVFANASFSLTAEKMANSQLKSPAFLTTVSVYDIETSTWYQQATTGFPQNTAWTQGCTVVASTPDGATHNIYYYGGFDGINLRAPFNDEVWILSLPSFTWVKAAVGRSGHGRAGHRCVKPYPDQMIVLGGYPAQGGTAQTCVTGGIVQLFNLTSLEWIDSYDPRVWGNYTVPAVVTAAVAGAGVTKWNNASLATIFKTSYDTTKIKPWYPYAYTTTPTNPTNPPVPTTTTVPAPGGGTPKWLAPVLGVVLTLVVLSALFIAFLLYRRRRYLRRRDSVAATSEVNRNRILSWVWGHDAKAGTVTSDETPSTAFEDDGTGVGSGSGRGGHLSTSSATVPSVNVVEAGGDMVYELPGTTRAQELSAGGQEEVGGVGLVYVPISGSGGLHPSPSVASTASRGSEFSADGGGGGSPGVVSPRGDSPGLVSPRGDSPARVSPNLTDSPGGGGRESPSTALGRGELDGGAGAGERRRSGPVTPRAERWGSVGSVGEGGGGMGGGGGGMSATGGLSPDGGSDGGGGGGGGRRRKSAFGEMLGEEK
ncbi:hypothetical protein VE00_08916 [Pseudogymnoascus sp. WSF 3629]|nr:hypothetical protein VE00_08916 [Pseudogymnoascus sp. WSF 3629]